MDDHQSPNDKPSPADRASHANHPGPGAIPLLSHLRWLAAWIVVLSHVEQDLLSKTGYVASTKPFELGLATKEIFRPGGYGHAAVIIFFVLSGFLVGGKLIELAASPTVGRDWPRFMVDRFSRIFIVLWPALLLTGAVFFGLLWFVPTAPFVHDGNWTFDLIAPLSSDTILSRWAAAAAMLNDLVAPTLETNGPLWSLAYEWCYYIIGLAAVLAFRRVFSPMALLFIVYGAALVLLCLSNQPDILFSRLSWVAGAAARVAFNRNTLRSAAWQLAGVVAVVAVLALERWFPSPDPVLGAALALMIAHRAWQRWTWGARLGDYLASFSYSLYAMHFPVLLAVMGVMFAAGWLPQRLPFNGLGLATAALAFGLTLVAARVFAYLTEDHTTGLRRALQKRLGLRSHRTAAVSPQPYVDPVQRAPASE